MKPSKIFIIFCSSLFWLHPCSPLLAADQVGEIIDRMTLSQKVGQILFIGFQGRALQPDDISHIQRMNPGGIIFYGRNIKYATDLIPLISKIQGFSEGHRLPMFFAVDQEGGIVHRIAGEFYQPPSFPAIGATDSDPFAREVGASVGQALRQLGINMNLAPVLDMPVSIRSSPLTMRCFGDRPQRVASLGVSYLRGLQEAGPLATAKHFPGIGRAQEDSHSKLPRIIWKSPEEREQDLLPFREAIQKGVDLIMVGHFIAQPGDPANPIPLSSYWMEDVLRKDMGFQGLIVVDNLEMKAIQGLMAIPEAAVGSFKAGADLITVSHRRTNQIAVFEALMGAVETGEISRERLHASLRRIIEAKVKMESQKPARLPRYNLREISKIVAENSIVLLPWKDAPPHSVKEDAILYVGYDSTLSQALKNTFGKVEVVNLPLSMYQSIKPALSFRQLLERYNFVVIDAGYPDAREVISACDGVNRDYAVVSYLLDLPKTMENIRPRRIVITFENTPAHVQAAVDVIRGTLKAKGRFPFRIPLPKPYT